jgi:thiosulfate reductase cytochrome b subunit
MAPSAYPGVAAQSLEHSSLAVPRNSILVRITHWINAISFVCLIVSGIAILIAHPRLYWGETGTVGTPALINLPIPFMLGHSGWGRYLHFLSAWICVLNGSLYVLSGAVGGHFRRDLLPHRSDQPAAVDRRDDLDSGYGSLQRVTYLGVVFLLFPAIIWTGLAMSPSIEAVFPGVVTALGGQQSARTIHFFLACLIVVFFVVHVAMVWREGFWRHVRAMTIGASSAPSARRDS